MKRARLSLPPCLSKIKLKHLQRDKTYKLSLTVTSADGQAASDRAKLKVKKT